MDRSTEMLESSESTSARSSGNARKIGLTEKCGQQCVNNEYGNTLKKHVNRTGYNSEDCRCADAV